MTPPAAATRTLPRTVAPRAPRRVSGPAARNRRDDARRKAARRSAVADPFGVRALRRTRQLADSRFLDRLIRGRLWIPLVAVGLMGIVFMQVTMLKFNAGIGRAVTSASTLEGQNAQLRADVSHLESGGRIAAEAHDLGMVVPADGSAQYVRATGAGQATTAAAKMTPADPGAIARAQAGTALAQGQAAGTTTTGSATAAPTPAQAAAASAGSDPAATTSAGSDPAAGQQPLPSNTDTATGAGTTTGTTGAATAPSAVAQQPAATGTTGGAAPTTTQQQQAQAQTASATSGGAVAPTPQG
jgi:hypothetical protein